MARISRAVVPGYPHHLTQRGVRSIPIFRDDRDRQKYIQLLREQTQRFGVDILAWCLMTNHVHFVAIPKNTDSLARAFGETHRLYTRMRNFAEGVRGYLFQGRFGSCVLNERHLLAAVRYIEMNPVRAGIAREAWTYPWSIAPFHTGQKEEDPLVSDRTLFGLVHGWRNFLSDQSPEMDSSIRKSTRTGRPAGDEGFVTLMERLISRDLTKGKPGRPSQRRNWK